MAEIFISYAREDHARAEALARTLASRGWTEWWDRHIPVGRSFSHVIEQELEAARCVVVLWSGVSVASDCVVTEAAEALRRNVLIPVVVEKGVRIPLEFRRIQTADLTEWPRMEEGDRKFAELVSAIAATVGWGHDEPVRPEPISPERPRPERARWAVLAAIVLAVALAVGAVAWWRGDAEPPGTDRLANTSFGPEVANGIMICEFIRDERVRIEVGIQLEQRVSNQEAGAIIKNDMAPAFQRAAYAEGLRDALAALEREASSGAK